MSDPITLDEFVDGMRGGCETPGCDHKHGVMHLRSRCHPTAGASVSVDSETLLMRIACRQCDEDIVVLDLAEDDFPPNFGLTPERISKGLSPEWTAEDRLLVVAALLPGMQDDIYAGRYSAMGRPNITSLQHLMSMPAEACEPYRADLEPLVKAFQTLVETGMRGSPEAVAPAETDVAVSRSAPLGSLTPARRLELAQIGHRVAHGMREAMAAQETAMRLAIRGLSPQSDDAIEAMAILLASFVRVGMEDAGPSLSDDIVEMIVRKASESYAHLMPDGAIGKLCERTKALVRSGGLTAVKAADLPS